MVVNFIVGINWPRRFSCFCTVWLWSLVRFSSILFRRSFSSLQSCNCRHSFPYSSWTNEYRVANVFLVAQQLYMSSCFLFVCLFVFLSHPNHGHTRLTESQPNQTIHNQTKLILTRLNQTQPNQANPTKPNSFILNLSWPNKIQPITKPNLFIHSRNGTWLK